MRSSTLLLGTCLLSFASALPATSQHSRSEHRAATSTGQTSSAVATSVAASPSGKSSPAPQQAGAVGAKNTSASSNVKAAAVAGAPAALPSVIRGVNLGGWLILEKWMNGDVFSGAFSGATDQWTFDSISGAQAALTQHWNTYITEADIAKMAGWGINAVRIPIGYWAYQNSVKGPYISGADAYLEKAIGWCRTNNIKVLIDVHGSPGSQNGFDNSGHAGTAAWQTGNNLQATTDVLVEVAKKYATPAYADTVFAIELTNEPISWAPNDFGKTQQWTKDAFAAVKAASTNSAIKIIMHDSFQNPKSWTSISSALNGQSSLANSQFWLDTHLYQNQVASDSTLNQAAHISKACNWSTTNLLPASSNLPVIVGEFSAQTNICANPDGSTVAGSVCTISKCQCSSNVDIQDWQDPLVQATRKFLEAELDTFEKHARGWFIWSYKAGGSWGLENIMQYGILGAKVTDRKYPGQCSS